MQNESTVLGNIQIAEPGVDAPATHGADNGAHAARIAFELMVHEKFARADLDALFTRAEIAVILNCSESFLEKGAGPNTRLVGRLRRSTKRDIVAYINDLPEGDDTTGYFRFA